MHLDICPVIMLFSIICSVTAALVDRKCTMNILFTSCLMLAIIAQLIAVDFFTCNKFTYKHAYLFIYKTPSTKANFTYKVAFT